MLIDLCNANLNKKMLISNHNSVFQLVIPQENTIKNWSNHITN